MALRIFPILRSRRRWAHTTFLRTSASSTDGRCSSATAALDPRPRTSGQRKRTAMKCIICSGSMSYHFSKQFDVYDLDKVDYVRCRDCGFSASETHFAMSDREWERLNHAFHSDSNAREDNPYN